MGLKLFWLGVVSAFRSHPRVGKWQVGWLLLRESRGSRAMLPSKLPPPMNRRCRIALYFRLTACRGTRTRAAVQLTRLPASDSETVVFMGGRSLGAFFAYAGRSNNKCNRAIAHHADAALCLLEHGITSGASRHFRGTRP